jgi:mRNA interferase MazF
MSLLQRRRIASVACAAAHNRPAGKSSRARAPSRQQRTVERSQRPRRMVILYGDVVWIDLPPSAGLGPGGCRPAVVLQQDRFNRSAIQSIVVAALTSNMKLAASPGNIRLRKGEAGLPKASVINVSQLMAVDRDLVTGKDRAIIGRAPCSPLGRRTPRARTARRNRRARAYCSVIFGPCAAVA